MRNGRKSVRPKPFAGEMQSDSMTINIYHFYSSENALSAKSSIQSQS